MKSCPKCNRTFAEDNQKFCTFDGGLLETAQEPFDPETTIASVSANRGFTSSETQGDNPAGNPLPDFNSTVATSPSSQTAVFPKNTGPTGATTASTRRPPPLPPLQHPPLPHTAVDQPKTKSKLPLILGIALLLLVLGVGAVVAIFFLVIRPRLNERRFDTPIVTKADKAENPTDNSGSTATNIETKTESEFVAPPNAVKFANSQGNLDGKLAEHYFDFSFYYPNTWAVDRNAGVPGASNFVKVERMLPPDFTQENFAVGWYTSGGTFAADEPTFPQIVELLEGNLANGFPEYRKVSEGRTKVNSLDGYEFRFVSLSKGTEKGDIQLWGRVIFLPTGVAGEQTGATLIMLATSLAPELSSVEDVGEKGEMPVILESFRFGKNR